VDNFLREWGEGHQEELFLSLGKDEDGEIECLSSKGIKEMIRKEGR